MSKQRSGGQPRFEESERLAGRRVSRGTCRECGGTELEPGRRSWCSQRCVDRYLVRSNPNRARRLVEQRDRGCCALCQRDCRSLEQEVARAIRAARAEWHAIDFERYRHIEPTLDWPADYLPIYRRHVLPVLERAGYPLGVYRRQSMWDMDHTVPVSRGGGECDLDNLRTLCILCHQHETARLRRGELNNP